MFLISPNHLDVEVFDLVRNKYSRVTLSTSIQELPGKSRVGGFVSGPNEPLPINGVIHRLEIRIVAHILGYPKRNPSPPA
jgi:hypothetical protein